MSSFHGDTITTTANKLIEICYDYSDQNTGDDKVNFDFVFKIPDGQEFYVYDWKEYRVLNKNEYVTFNIGADSSEESREALEYIYELIN